MSGCGVFVPAYLWVVGLLDQIGADVASCLPQKLFAEVDPQRLLLSIAPDLQICRRRLGKAAQGGHGFGRGIETNAIDACDDVAILQARAIEQASIASRSQSIADELTAIGVRFNAEDIE